jgi:hypothetical protein
MKKKNKDIIYIPHQDTWSEHFPTPGKLRPSNFGHMFCEPNSQFNKHLRTQNKLKNENPTTNPSNPIYLVIINPQG